MKKILSFIILAAVIAGCQKDRQHRYDVPDKVRPIDCNCSVEQPAWVDSVLSRGPDHSLYRIHDAHGHSTTIWDINLLGLE